MKVFASTMLYALAKSVGMQAALAEFRRQSENPDKDSLPVVRTLHRLRTLADLQVHVDCGATCIGKARSRAFYEALFSHCDAWVSIDDDIEVTTATASELIYQLGDGAARVVVVPCMLRAPNTLEPRLNVNLPLVRVADARVVKLPHGTPAGFGMVGMNRRALERVAESGASSFLDDDGKVKLAVFHDELADGKWYGEDVSFFRRVPDDVEVLALLFGTSKHAGVPLELAKL